MKKRKTGGMYVCVWGGGGGGGGEYWTKKIEKM